MSDPATKPRRQRQQFPVEVTIWAPGARAPRRVAALWHTREPGADLFGLPEKRFYMKRTLRVPDSAGVVLEIMEMVSAQVEAVAPRPAHAPPTPGEFLRANEPVPARPLRAVVSGGVPASEAVDENGTPVVLPAAFGMLPG